MIEPIRFTEAACVSRALEQLTALGCAFDMHCHQDADGGPVYTFLVPDPVGRACVLAVRGVAGETAPVAQDARQLRHDARRIYADEGFREDLLIYDTARVMQAADGSAWVQAWVRMPPNCKPGCEENR